MFGSFKPKSKLQIAIKAPDSFETNALSLALALIVASPVQDKIERISVRLRADPVKRGASNKSYVIIGESVLQQGLILAPNKPEQINYNLSLDFSPIDSFDIPPENLAVASAEMKAAAAANRTAHYRYSLEVVYKTASGEDRTLTQPIRLIQPGEVRAG